LSPSHMLRSSAPLLLSRSAPPSAPPSFPTRRSSDLHVHHEDHKQRHGVADDLLGQPLPDLCVGLPVILFHDRFHIGRSSYVYVRSEEHTSELQSRFDLVCRLLLEKKKHTAYTDERRA